MSNNVYKYTKRLFKPYLETYMYPQGVMHLKIDFHQYNLVAESVVYLILD